MFISLTTIAQVKKNHSVTGISIFQIGDSRDKILHELDSLGYKGPIQESAYKLTKYHSNELRGSKIIYKGKLSEDTAKINPDNVYSTNLYLEWDMFNPNVEKYFIQSFQITEEIILQNVELLFLNGNLEYFTADWDKKITDALTLKYGEPNSKFTEKEIACTYKYTGASVTYKEFESTDTWDNSNGIQVKSYFEKYYDDSCKEQFVTLFSVSKDHNSFKNISGQSYYKIWLDNKKTVNDSKKKSALDKF